MLDPKKQAEFEQSFALLAEGLPPMCKGIFDGLLKEKFTEPQAMKILCTYIKTAFRSGS